MDSPAEMRTRVTTVIIGFGVKQGRSRIEKPTDDEIMSLNHFCSAARAYKIVTHGYTSIYLNEDFLYHYYLPIASVKVVTVQDKSISCPPAVSI